MDVTQSLFTVIDPKTGKYPDIQALIRGNSSEEWAHNLMYTDIEGFALTEDNQLMLLDECGNTAYVPYGRFIVTFTGPRSDERFTSKMIICPKGWKGTKYTKYFCPACKKLVRRYEPHCHNCGQALLYPTEQVDVETNKIWLDFENPQ